MAPRVTTIELGDLERLVEVDVEYVRSADAEPVIDRASVHFFQRSGHSFAARSADGLLGFVLAYASWSGGRPVVRVERLATAAASGSVAAALVEAVVKSAYDAGVYDIVAAVPDRDELASAALSDASFEERALTVFSRVLGSRGSTNYQGGRDAAAR